jgi:hypothetical protein
MQPIIASQIEPVLRRYEGQTIYLHVEVPDYGNFHKLEAPGAFARNIKALIIQSFIAGSGPYRVALKIADDGWIRVEGLTHFVIDEKERLIIAGHDNEGRLTVGLEINGEPFSA